MMIWKKMVKGLIILFLKDASEENANFFGRKKIGNELKIRLAVISKFRIIKFVQEIFYEKLFKNT